MGVLIHVNGHREILLQGCQFNLFADRAVYKTGTYHNKDQKRDAFGNIFGTVSFSFG